jgi:hypothetical protein
MCSAQCEPLLLEDSNAAVTACLHILNRWHVLTARNNLRAVERKVVSDFPPVCFGPRLSPYVAPRHQTQAGSPGPALHCESSR